VVETMAPPQDVVEKLPDGEVVFKEASGKALPPTKYLILTPITPQSLRFWDLDPRATGNLWHIPPQATPDS